MSKKTVLNCKFRIAVSEKEFLCYFEGMTIRNAIKERGLTIDDVRWYISEETAKRLLTYEDKEYELSRLIWSGQLEDDLYDMEERFLSELQEKIDSERIDEPRLNLILSEIEAAKRRRRSQER
jgi:hypothetical protein